MLFVRAEKPDLRQPVKAPSSLIAGEKSVSIDRNYEGLPMCGGCLTSG